VLIQATATSLAVLTGLTVTVAGQPVTLDAQGRAEVVAPAPGRLLIEAKATDADGLVGRTVAVLKVRDPNDQTAPVVSFDPALGNARLISATDVRATVEDVNLDSWVLELAPFGAGAFTSLAAGNDSVAGTLAHLDPGALVNGFYRLRLTAADISGRASMAE